MYKDPSLGAGSRTENLLVVGQTSQPSDFSGDKQCTKIHQQSIANLQHLSLYHGKIKRVEDNKVYSPPILKKKKKKN